MAPRIKQYVDRMTQSRMEIFDEGVSRKRGLPSEPTDGLNNNKRRRLGAEIPETQGAKLLPNGPNSLAQLFTLTNDPNLASFDVSQLPQDLAIIITQGLLTHINQQELDGAVNNVRSRYLALGKGGQLAALGDDEEDYEPDFEPNEDREQILNRTDALPPEDSPEEQSEVSLGPFKLPQPPRLSQSETEEIGKATIGRVFGMMNVLNEPSGTKRRKPGLNRLAGSNYDREAWITFIARIATRASAGLHNEDEQKDDPSALIKAQNGKTNLSDTIRENLWRYIIEDFRVRIHIAIAWLNEEWFNDKMQEQAHNLKARGGNARPPRANYETWVLKILDAIMPYLDARESKLLLRFLSEIPVVSQQVIERVKSLARDPERVDLAVKAIQYVWINE